MTGSVDAPAPGPIVWLDLEPTAPGDAGAAFDDHLFGAWSGHVGHDGQGSSVLHDGVMHRVTRPLSWLGARLIAPPGDDLRRWHSMDVTCRVRRSADDAIEALGRTDAIEWGQGRHPSRLSIRGIRTERSTLGGPLLADAVVRGRRTGEIDLTIAIFDGNRDTCLVQLRRSGRSTWGLRRRRRCMAATHDAADRLIEQILAVDFRPPAESAGAPLPA